MYKFKNQQTGIETGAAGAFVVSLTSICKTLIQGYNIGGQFRVVVEPSGAAYIQSVVRKVDGKNTKIDPSTYHPAQIKEVLKFAKSAIKTAQNNATNGREKVQGLQTF